MNRSCNSILCRFGIHTADPYSEIGRVVDKLTREKMISLHDFERKEKHYE